MKNYILLTIIVSVMVLGFWYALNKSMDNRCDYYKTLTMTKTMKEICK